MIPSLHRLTSALLVTVFTSFILIFFTNKEIVKKNTIAGLQNQELSIKYNCLFILLIYYLSSTNYAFNIINFQIIFF